ncbi:hypothetical protein B296_00014790 [Ensete ventricosum]|uniref:Uncharacterized protein n=1 Tax=Ensete ventricosum TaxID=4639 RepID=A0A426ZQ42_ENSVE|nr:hypothetical protein B296_00014790 [Ensete ventricosum]
MRLNRVELFYMLVAAIGSESRCCLRGRGGHMHAVCMQRWLAMARPPAGAAARKGGHPRARSAVASLVASRGCGAARGMVAANRKGQPSPA